MQLSRSCRLTIQLAPQLEMRVCNKLQAPRRDTVARGADTALNAYMQLWLLQIAFSLLSNSSYEQAGRTTCTSGAALDIVSDKDALHRQRAPGMAQ